MKFSELDNVAKEKAIEEYREGNPDYPWYEWWDFLFEDFKCELKEIGIECKGFYFDFYQNRFIKIEEPYIAEPKKFLISAGFNRELVLLNLSGSGDDIIISINNETRELMNSISCEFDYYDEDKELREIFDSEEELGSALESFLHSILEGFLKRLEQEYDYLCSDECIADNLEANDFCFLEDGTIVW